MKKNVDKIMMGRDAVKAESVRGKVFAAVAWVAVSLAVMGMLGGCGEDAYVHWGGRYEGSLLAFVDDSLVLLKNSRGYEECHEIFMQSDECEAGGKNDGLFLVNYREKREPLWGDTIEGTINLIEGFYADSSALFFNAKEEFGFWKIGSKPRVVRKWKCASPCLCGSKKYGRPWIKGDVLLKMDQDECPYAVLDTATGVVSALEFKGGYAWLEGCDDIAFLKSKVVCLKRFDGAMGKISFVVENFSLDSINRDDFLGYTPLFYGEYVKIQVYKNGNLISKIGQNGFYKETFPETWFRYNNFIDSAGVSIFYASEDLIVTE